MSVIYPGEEYLVSEEDLKSSHWEAVKPAKPAKPAKRAAGKKKTAAAVPAGNPDPPAADDVPGEPDPHPADQPDDGNGGDS